jgi:peptidoglycan/xylan/chitin deacetylase (PgdA/CDA1 family)
VTVGGHADHGRPPAPTRATTHRPAATTQPAGATQAAGALRAALPGAHHATHEAVPILMYHVIGDIRPGTPNPTLWVSPRDFEAHVRALRRAGYHGVTLQQVYNAWHRHALLPSRPVVLSFDDGYLGQVRFALPVLARAGWPGVLNLKLGNINDMGGTRAIRRMIRAGWEVDSHTISHPDLTTLDGPRLHYELAGSRARLRRYFRVAVNFICYPSGRFDDTVVAAARSAGYRAATTTQPGWARPADDRFTLPRVRVDGGMTAHAVLQRMRDARAP